MNRHDHLLHFVLALVVCLVAQGEAQWMPTRNLSGQNVRSIVVYGDTLFVGTRGGVFESTDNGFSWHEMNVGLANTDVRALILIDTTLLAGTNGGGVFRSSVHAVQWTPSNTDLPNNSSVTTIFGLVDSTSVVYIGTESGDVYLSPDRGQHWAPQKRPGRVVNCFGYYRPRYYHHIELLAGTAGGGIFSSTEPGIYWDSSAGDGSGSGLAGRDIRALLSGSDNRVYAATDSGVFAYLSEPPDWYTLNNGLTDRSTFSLASRGSTIFLASRYDVWQTVDTAFAYGSEDSSRWSPVGSTYSSVQTLLATDSELFAGSLSKGVFIMGISSPLWHSSYYGLTSYGISGKFTEIDGAFLAVSSHGRILYSADQGLSWNELDSLIDGPVSALAVFKGYLLAGTSRGRIYQSSDHGSTWQQLGSGVPSTNAIREILIRGMNLFVVVSDTKNPVYESSDLGNSWRPLGPQRFNVFSLVGLDSALIAVEHFPAALLRSTDEGMTWARENVGVPDDGSTVQDISGSRRDVFATYLYCSSGCQDRVPYSSDNGQTWIDRSTGLPQNGLFQLSPVIGRNILTSDFYLTTNLGITWNKVDDGLPPEASSTWVSRAGPFAFTEVNDTIWRRPLAELIADLSIDRDSLSYGSVGVEKSDSLNLLIRNVGSAPLIIDSTHAEDLSFSIRPSSDTILARSSGSFVVRFTPRSGGDHNSVIHFYHSAESYPAKIEVSGFGVLPPLSPAPYMPLNGTVNQRQPVSLIWNSVSTADSFHVQLSTDSTFALPPDREAIIKDTMFVAQNLKDSTRYYWRVQAENKGGTSPPSGPWSFLTIRSLPPAPVSLHPSTDSVNLRIPVMLSWSNVTTADSYHVQVSKDTGFVDTSPLDSTLATETVLVSNLSDSILYFWRVQSKNIAGPGPYTSPQTFTTIRAKPSYPDLTAPPDNASKVRLPVTLRWSKITGADSYHVQLSTDSKFVTANSVDSTLAGTSILVQGLSDSVRYYWHVRSENISGVSRYAAARNFVTIRALPPSPSLVFPANGEANLRIPVRLEWTRVVTADSFQVQVSKYSDFHGTQAFDTTVASADTTVWASTLSDSTRYYWRVFAWNEAGPSLNPFVSDFTTIVSPALAPHLVFPLDSSIDQPASIKFTWDSVPGALSYRIQISSDVGFVKLFLDDTTTLPSKTLSGFSLDSTYYWRVSTRNIAGSAGPSLRAFRFSTPHYEPELRGISSPPFAFTPHDKAEDYDPSEYRLFGLPGDNNQMVVTVVSGDQDHDWQVYWDNGGAQDYMIRFDWRNPDFLEKVGRGFWIVTKKPNFKLNNVRVPAAHLDSTFSASILLHPGWNIIANPFSKSVSWAAVQLSDSITDELWAFSGSWEGGQDSLTPFIGYYFFNSRNLKELKIPLVGPNAPAVATPTSEMAWRVNIGLATGGFFENSAYFGLSKTFGKINPRMVRKPRAIGPLPSVYFNRPEVDSHYPFFASDVRTGGDSLQKWDFKAYTGKHRHATLSFTGLRSIPADLAVYLRDQGRRRWVDLRTDSLYRFDPAGVESDFTIFVGRGDGLNGRMEDATPVEFALGACFPNPFNLSTTFSVDLPKPSIMDLGVYNILGERVRTLYYGPLGEGRSWFTWDGEDDKGNVAPSGAYVYRMRTAGGIVLAGRMVLIK